MAFWSNYQATFETPQSLMTATDYTLTITDRDGETASMTLTPSVVEASEPDFQDDQIRVLWTLNQGCSRGAEITITVTSADGSRTRVYRLLLREEEAAGPNLDYLRGIVDACFSLVRYEGGSMADLEVCA